MCLGGVTDILSRRLGIPKGNVSKRGLGTELGIDLK